MVKQVEEIYKKKNLHQHILDRPDSYIGSTKLTTEERFVCSKEEKIVKKVVEYNPGLIKIFDEILVNAIDHTVREASAKTIKVDIDAASGEITVFNDGPGVPVVLHKEYKVYIPELIFGNLLTSSNYDDTQKRIVGGVNGLGSKCTNIFSKKFVIETVDSENHKFYKQEFSDNMFTKEKPEIKTSRLKSYTKITFLPDYQRFGMKKLTKDTVALLKKRVYDTTACTNKDVSVYLNGKKLKQKDFVSYVSLYTDEKTINEKFIEGDMIWEVAAYFTETPGFVSFVNGIDTYNGGKHVEYISTQIVKKLGVLIQTKKKTEVKPSYIKDRLFLFVKSTIVNPSFTSQSKEALTTNVKDFGIKIELSDKFIDKIYKSGIVDDILSFVKYKDEKAIAKNTDKTSRKVRLNIPKLEDANYAGTARSKDCVLILTEGDSAKTFAVSGLSIVGRNHYGVMPLKGKALNVREATTSQLLNNEEINNLKKIIGLEHGKKYTSVNSLRYGKIMILADADSVTFDTPILLKDLNTEEIITKPICEINQDDWVIDPESGKEYGTSSKYLVWSDNGWAQIRGIMRHRVNKPIFRVNTSKGCVDVTEDHSILSSDGEEITVNDITLNETELLHREFVQEKYFDYGITKELAYGMGYFMADGFCSTELKTTQKNGTVSHNSKWEITCIDKDVLHSLKQIFEKHENNSDTTTFNVRETKRTSPSFSNKEFIYTLEAKGNRKQIASKYRDMFYNSLREKQVPVKILNSSVEIQKMFLEGFYAGDGNKSVTGDKTRTFDIQHKTSILGMFQLLQNCGYRPSINCNHKKLNVYSINMSKFNCRPTHRVKKLLDVSEKYKDTYVYDIETDNHHFHAGNGNIIVHNCDGIHIKGLIMNFFHTWWPELLEIPGFLTSLRTPIIKSVRGKEMIEFYSQFEYQKWCETIDPKKWNIKYYKGLGTSTADEAKKLFKKLDVNKMDYFSENEKSTKKAMLLAFEKKKADDRKVWLQKQRPEEILDFSQTKMTFDDFINKELIQFSLSDIVRSIPSIYDGLKPSQRKVLYTLLTKNYKKEIKVAQFGAAVAELTAYHHGEVSLFSTIINMAQNYTGSNNINLLKPNGQFGCVDPYTEILMADGSIKLAKEVYLGDKLMGDDGTPRKVLALTEGVDKMYKVKYSNGETLIVNSEHILTFKVKCHKMTKYLKHRMAWVFTYFDQHLLTMKRIEYLDEAFEEPRGDIKTRKNIVLEYIEDTFARISDNDIFDIKISDYLKIDDFTKSFMFAVEAKKIFIFYNSYSFTGIDFYEYGLNCTSKFFIPQEYKCSSPYNRFDILKGFLHSIKSWLIKENDRFYIPITKLSDDLVKDIKFLFKSIGVNCYNEDEKFLVVKGKAIYNLFFYYTFDDLPYALDIVETTLGIEIQYNNIGEFNGWELSGNKRFLLSNFIITHNSRLQNGKDAASPRYIFTEINDITRKIFKDVDSHILEYQKEEEMEIEPRHYMPIIPMILVNGTQGIGTGFSTFIPPYNVEDIINNMKRYVEGKSLKEMTPYYRNFKGSIIKQNDNSYTIFGKYEKIDSVSLKITELPVGTSTEEYVTFVKSTIDAGNLKDFINNSTEEIINITLVFNDAKTLDSYIKTPELLYKNLKLSRKISTGNMHLFNKDDKIQRYENALEILKEFMEIRLCYNQKRKVYLIDMYTKKMEILNAKIRFIEEIINGTLVVYREKREKIIDMLISHKYKKIENSYDYLLSLPVYSFTYEKIKELKDKHETNQNLLNDIQNKTEKDIMVDDLKSL